eukprot:sb/3479348/
MVGGLFANFLGGLMYDLLGTKKTVLCGSAVILLSSFGGVFCNGYPLLMVVRYGQGFGTYLALNGPYVLASDLIPSRFREAIIATGLTMLSVGTVPLVAMSLISDWRRSYYMTIIYCLVFSLPLVFLTESPRSDIIRGKVAQAEASFRRIAQINKTEWKGFDSDPDSSQGRVLKNEQEKLCYYGINYAWDKIVPVASSGYFFSMAVQISANIAFIPAMRVLESPCDVPDWEQEVDFYWVPRSHRTSYILDFNLTCASPLIKDTVATMPMVGGLFANFLGGLMYDLLGTKKTVLCGSAVILLSSFGGVFCNGYPLLMVVRYGQGFGTYLALNGPYVLASDLIPSSLPLVFLTESPRSDIIRGKVAQAEASFRRIAQINKTEWKGFDSDPDSSQGRVLKNEQEKLCYYGINYAWDKIVPVASSGYFFSMAVQISANIAFIPAMRVLESPCDVPDWEQEVDFYWVPRSHRTSYILDFNLTCASPLIKDTVATMPMVGGLFANFLGGLMYDLLGTKKTVLCGSAVILLSSFGGVFCNGYPLLMVVRYGQGFGTYLALNGPYVLASDLIPSSLPLVFLTESPRSDIIRGKVAQAEASFRRIAQINKTEWKGFDSDPDSSQGRVLKNEQEKVALKDQFLTFLLHKILFLETLAQIILWWVIQLCYYGINYAWDKIVPVASSGYFFSMAVQISANIAFIPAMRVLGRRRYMACRMVFRHCCPAPRHWRSNKHCPTGKQRMDSRQHCEHFGAILCKYLVSIRAYAYGIWSYRPVPTLEPLLVCVPPRPRSLVWHARFWAMLSYLLPETLGQPITSSPEEVKQRRLLGNQYHETLAQIILWWVIQLCYYGINYAWDKIVPVASSGYFFSMAVQISANIAFIPAMRVLGRRRYMAWSFVIAALLLAIGGATSTKHCPTGVQLGNKGWTVASIASILAQFFVSGVYTGICLWNMELSGLARTGTVIGLCASTLEILLVCVPPLPGSLVDATGGWVVSFSIMVGLCLVGAMLSYLLPETLGQPITSSPEEVKQRRLLGNQYHELSEIESVFREVNTILPRDNKPLEVELLRI